MICGYNPHRLKRIIWLQWQWIAPEKDLIILIIIEFQFPSLVTVCVRVLTCETRSYEQTHSCLRGDPRNPTNSWWCGPQGLPTTLNISTNMVIHPAIPPSLWNLAISESSQNLVKNSSIRVSTEIPPHPEPRTSGDHHREAYGDLEWVIGFHLSPNSACPRLSLAC